VSRFRRVERTAQLAHTVDVHDAIRRLKDALAKIPNVEIEPRPDVEIVDLNQRGPVLAVRPYTHTDHYWQVYFDTNAAKRRYLRRGRLPGSRRASSHA
jgi:small conductance mechanosensitive channel